MTILREIMIDTFSWSKLFKLAMEGWDWILESLFEEFHVIITQEVKNEVLYRYPQRNQIIRKATILGQSNTDYTSLNKDGFDDADASLIISSREKGYPVITEDHPMIFQATLEGLHFMQLIDLFLILYQRNVLSVNDLRKLLRVLRRMRNITKKKEKGIQQALL